MSLRQYDRGTWWLHLGMAVTVTVQLMCSCVMRVPKPGREITFFQSATFNIHLYCGILAFIIVCCHWGWTILGKDKKNLTHLFPWKKNDRKNIWTDLVSFFYNRRLPEGGPRVGLPGLIHGGGLVVVTIMATSGLIMFVFFRFFSVWKGYANPAKTVHEFMAWFAWIYWWGHVGMVWLHWLYARVKTSVPD